MLAVQPGGLDGANEELGAVGVGTSVGHRQDTGAFVTELEVLISKLLAVNGATTSAVVTCEITALTHEVGNDAVEGRVLEGQVGTLLASAQGTEVFGGAGDDVGTEFHYNATEGGTIGSHIEEDARIGHFFFGLQGFSFSILNYTLTWNILEVGELDPGIVI